MLLTPNQGSSYFKPYLVADGQAALRPRVRSASITDSLSQLLTESISATHAWWEKLAFRIYMARWQRRYRLRVLERSAREIRSRRLV